MDFVRKKMRLGDTLVADGVLSEEQLSKALGIQKGSGKRLGEVLVDSGMLTEEEIARALSRQMGLDYIDLRDVHVSNKVLRLVPQNVLRKNNVFPFEYAKDNANILRVAMVDPLDMNAMDDIAIVTSLQIEPVVTTTRSLMMALDTAYGEQTSATGDALAAYNRDNSRT